MQKLLVIDDNVSFLNDVESLLKTRFTVVTASSGKRGIELAQSEGVTAVLLDLKMPDISGMEVLRRIHDHIDPHLPVIIVTDQREVDTAVEAMRLGAYDFIPKSFNLDLLTAKVVKALERRSLELSVGALKSSQADHFDRLVVASEAMNKVRFEVDRLARLDFDVLICGETGAGKDLIAFELHRRSPRREHPFLPVPMKTLNETLIESELFGHERGAFSGAEKAKVGKLEAADGGAVYLPEVSSFSELVQLKLLQFMQYKTIARVGQDPRKPEINVDVRIIMATNESLEEVVRRGAMREDFYHRISGVRLMIPPLRERPEDIEPLAVYFLKKHTSTLGGMQFEFAPGVLDRLRAYRWPGNVRELENAIKNAIAYSATGRLTIADFPRLREEEQGENDTCRICMAARASLDLPYQTIERNFKRAYFAEILRRSGNNVTKAASAAGLTPQGFRKIMNGLDIRKK